ncbi:WXG100 family type VII secretion target [Saccharothrix syringae]|uniref:ESAT-6-like protein n=1 Tax=Saccharothrix syringae TaxID=103733 RepID=A0A5Q0HBV9_SACSY|nr:WXG100 family type VII secretion target [Saccharothrix syringae]QFZ23435.1 WXG100 family type VII secretion target [Saccharothrix syringae]
MVDANLIKVSFADMASAASDITSQANQVQSELDNLKSRLAPVIAQWDGNASGSYQAAQQAWDEAAAGLQQVMATIGVAVQQAGEAYQAAEQKNTSRWGG